MNKNLSVKSVREEALKEVQKENVEKAKRRYTELFHSLARAKKVVKNIEGELDELDIEFDENS